MSTVHELKSETRTEEYMPKVGEVCEARFRHPGTDFSDWFGNAKFKAGYDSKIWFCCDVNEPFSKEMVLPAHDIEFRPIKSEQERIESLVEKCVDEVINSDQRWGFATLTKALLSCEGLNIQLVEEAANNE